MSPPDPSDHSPLLVVSNRLPYNLPKPGTDRMPRRNVGGLVNALEPVLARRGGAWIGWDGVSTRRGGNLDDPARVRTFRTDTGVDLYGVPISETEIDRYYYGLSNRTLWPLFHNVPDKAVFDTSDYRAYVAVNRRFARILAGRLGERDRVWVHDYQLMLVPGMLRGLGFRGRIDFFLHIPFPAPELFLALPWRTDLLEGLLASDTVAFHIDSYRRNFVRTASMLFPDLEVAMQANGDLLLKTARHGSAHVRTAALGVDVDEFSRIAGLESVDAKVRRIRRSAHDRRIVFGADRLDYTKGIRERLLAVERYIVEHPEAAGTFNFVQVLVPSRGQVEEYNQLKREIDELVGRINGQHGREGWIPVHYRYRSLNREELVAHYRAATVALVTPLRDGLNLVAAEFVTSRTDHDGVLVLSEFAGIAEQLEDAVLVNPYDVEACAAAIHTALEMDPADRRFRMTRMFERMRSNTTADWARNCLAPYADGAIDESSLRRAADAVAGLGLRDRS